MYKLSVYVLEDQSTVQEVLIFVHDVTATLRELPLQDGPDQVDVAPLTFPLPYPGLYSTRFDTSSFVRL